MMPSSTVRELSFRGRPLMAGGVEGLDDARVLKDRLEGLEAARSAQDLAPKRATVSGSVTGGRCETMSPRRWEQLNPGRFHEGAEADLTSTVTEPGRAEPAGVEALQVQPARREE